MIQFKNVTKIFPRGVVALKDVDLTINKGEFVILVGKSGAGKTTLLKLINKELEPTHGKIFFEDVCLCDIAPVQAQTYRQKIGNIFQDVRLISTRNVYENISFAMEVMNASDSDICRDVPTILDLVGLRQKMQCFPTELSGGEKQKVAIARAMIHRPGVILADEPTGNLDVYNARDVIDSLVKLNDMGATVVLATHNEKTVNLLKKRVITLENGHIIRDQEKGKFLL